MSAAPARGVSGYGPWPYANPFAGAMPATLPGGSPWPKISVVTPSFNQARYIEQTILSVANQEYPNVEHILIDGGSTDDTMAIVDQYRQKLAWVVSEKDRGQSHAINKGMARATGEILTWLNSDDMLAPGALASMALAFHTSRADMVAGICRIYSEGVLIDQHLTCCPDGPLPIDDLLDLEGCWLQGKFFYQPEVMFRRALWERAGGRVDESLYYSMDYELWLRFAEAGAVLHAIGRPVAWFRRHSEQKTDAEARFRAELKEFRDGYLRRTGRDFRPAAPAPPSRRHLRIAMLNDHGFRYGAGIAHKRIAECLASAGHEVFPISLASYTTDNGVLGPDGPRVVEDVARCQPDLVVVGNLHSANPDPAMLLELSQRFPVACVLHDFWLLTGRCAYPRECVKHLEGCDETCATAHEYPPLEPSRIAAAWQAKRSIVSDHSLILLANSSWTADYARGALSANPGGRARVERFHLSFDLETFQPFDKRLSRKVLGLPQEEFIILMTNEFKDPRKRANLLLDALNELQLPDALLVSASWSDPDPAHAGSLKIRRMGYVDEPERLAMLYSAADLFVSASREETFGQTFIEASACGIPVLGFDGSGISEAIAEGIMGRMVRGSKASDLAEAILGLYRDPILRLDLARWGRLYVENEWSAFSAYREFFLALQRAGFVRKMGLPPKIAFLPRATTVREPGAAKPAAVQTTQALWEKEGPLPQYNLPEFRWALGPVSAFEFQSGKGSRSLVAIYYRNLHPGQTVTIEFNGAPCGEFALHETGITQDHLVTVRVLLREGSNQVKLSFGRWGGPAGDGRPLAMIITKVVVAAATVSAVPVM
jgi:glycosyltransferase involved in cell wall biosynthesis